MRVRGRRGAHGTGRAFLSTPDDVAALLAREAEALLSGDPETRAAVNA